MIKETIWVIYSLGALIGTMVKEDSDFFNPENYAFKAGLVADKMLDEYKNRFLDGWKGK